MLSYFRSRVCRTGPHLKFQLKWIQLVPGTTVKKWLQSHENFASHLISITLQKCCLTTPYLNNYFVLVYFVLNFQVSGDCEVLAINKKFFMKHCDDALISLIKLKVGQFAFRWKYFPPLNLVILL